LLIAWDISRYDRRRQVGQTIDVKKAILATVVSVERKSLDSVVVELESDELEKGTAIVSTGLDFERGCKSTKLGLEVTCAGDPRAETGDTVPVVISSEQGS
jgi:hypothetical protein